MPDSERIQATREMYRAYQDNDREAAEGLIGEHFEFFSPADAGIDRDRYFERCWPNAQNIELFEFVRLVESGEDVLVTYEAKRADGTRFRNTEVLGFEGSKLAKVEVYFGWEVS